MNTNEDRERKLWDHLQKYFRLVLDVTTKSNIHYQVWDCEGYAVIVDNNRADKKMLYFWDVMETAKAVSMVKKFAA